MISGAHMILYSTDADADRAFFRDVLKFPAVDAGRGWLIFALPPAEVAVHPASENGRHEIYLMCDDVAKTIGDLALHKVECAPIADEGWGLLTRVTLPGGGTLACTSHGIPWHIKPPPLDGVSAAFRLHMIQGALPATGGVSCEERGFFAAAFSPIPVRTGGNWTD